LLDLWESPDPLGTYKRELSGEQKRAERVMKEAKIYVID